MSAAYDRLVDRFVHRRIALGRYSTHVVRQVLGLLQRTETTVVDRVKLADDSLSGDRLRRLVQELRTVMDAGYTLLNQHLEGELDALAGPESRFVGTTLKEAGATINLDDLPSVSQIVAAAKARPFQGVHLRDALRELSDNAAKRVRNAVQSGFVEGQSPAQVARTLRGTAAARYKDGVLATSRRGAETLVRTAVTHTASVAAQETYDAFSDVVSGVVWSSILDGRTTLICIGLNGRHFPVDSGKRPPAHWGCRSIIVPEIKGVESAPIPSYADWLKRQTVAQQDDVLGPARARLWRAGKVALESFTDRKGQVLTLEQLAAR